MSVGLPPTSPVLVRVNFDDARFNGVEFNTAARLNDQFSANANFTYIRAHSLLNGLPPNVEGGIPPATGFVSFRYQPRSRFYLEAYSTLTGRQRRLSSLDLADRRTGAARSRDNYSELLPSRRLRARSNNARARRLRLCRRHPDPDRRDTGPGAEPAAANRRDHQRRDVVDNDTSNVPLFTAVAGLRTGRLARRDPLWRTLGSLR